MSVEKSFSEARLALVNNVLIPNGIYDIRVRRAIAKIPRHLFLEHRYWSQAYKNQVMPIAYRQTMLPPLWIAKMLQILALNGTENILEVGTGTAYLTALLAELGHYVYSLERIMPLAERAARHLQTITCHNVDLHIGDGSQGLADMSPFEAIVVTASVPKIPRPLAMQLHPATGRMIIPIGQGKEQTLAFVQRKGNYWHKRNIARVRLNPLIGQYGIHPPDAPSIAGM